METICELLEQWAAERPNNIALVEINPQELDSKRTTWREYSLIETSPVDKFY